MTITYRPATPSSVRHDKLLIVSHPDSTKMWRQQVITAFSQSQYVATAWDGKLLVGTVRVISDKVSFALVSDLLVHPDYRRQGIASNLLKMCTVSFDDYFLYADPVDSSINLLYEKNGFCLHPLMRKIPK